MFVIRCYFYEFIIHSSYGEARVRRSRTLVEFNFLDERGSLGGVDNFEFFRSCNFIWIPVQVEAESSIRSVTASDIGFPEIAIPNSRSLFH